MGIFYCHFIAKIALKNGNGMNLKVFKVNKKSFNKITVKLDYEHL